MFRLERWVRVLRRFFSFNTLLLRSRDLLFCPLANYFIYNSPIYVTRGREGQDSSIVESPTSPINSNFILPTWCRENFVCTIHGFKWLSVGVREGKFTVNRYFGNVCGQFHILSSPTF